MRNTQTHFTDERSRSYVINGLRAARLDRMDSMRDLEQATYEEDSDARIAEAIFDRAEDQERAELLDLYAALLA